MIVRLAVLLGFLAACSSPSVEPDAPDFANRPYTTESGLYFTHSDFRMNLQMSVDGVMSEPEAVRKSRSHALREVKIQVMDALGAFEEASQPATQDEVRAVVDAILADAVFPEGTKVSLDFEPRKWR